ncbi:hypothetical protein [Methylomarinum vadi]|uniref:hypothetical protein n=1 Tax=Methylomarinum vadi TaxID=438855 RepID=UPI0004DF4445|nr:hypothetical protein [Methylomarinum vadi]
MRYLLTILTLCLPLSVAAQMTTCTLTYSLQGWSFVYKEYKGQGLVSCRNGQRANVSIISRGGGFTIGKSEINHGTGVITEVKNIQEVFGTYAFLDGHAGATKSVEGRVMTKGEVSLALAGYGRGFDIGVAIGALTIKPR